MMRVCKKCGEEKPIEEFRIVNDKRKGSQYRKTKCKDCDRKHQRDIYCNIRERKIEKCRLFRQNNPEVIKGLNERYRKAKREKLRQIALEYYEKNKDERREYAKRYQRMEREELSEYYIKHRIKRNTGLSTETIKQHPELIENHKMQIKVKRLLKQKKNENTETS